MWQIAHIGLAVLSGLRSVSGWKLFGSTFLIFKDSFGLVFLAENHNSSEKEASELSDKNAKEGHFLFDLFFVL